jgi:hypothetical protein
VCLAVGSLPAAAPQPTGKFVFTQIPAGADADLPAGSRVVVFDSSAPDSGLANLTPGFHAAGRADLSFDGRRILFVGRQAPTDSLDVWEAAVDGSTLRRVVTRPENVTQAIYLSSIYTLNADGPARQIAFSVTTGDGDDRRSTLYTSRRDGSQVRRVTFDPFGASDPHLLSDGRLLYSGGHAAFAQRGTALFTINTDGTDVSAFAATHEQPALRGMPCETDDGQIVYVESNADTPLGGGTLVAVARTRSLHTRRVIAPAVDDAYHSPSPMAEGRLLVSYREKSDGSYGVYVLDPRSGARIHKLFDSPDWEDVEPVAVKARFEPPGRSSVVDERVSSGHLYCLDAYLTDLGPPGGLETGAIEVLRVVRSSSTAAEETVLGEIPVRPDGSFYLQIPARTPLRLEILGRDGQVLQAMRNSFWVMPGERRGCIGCHEDRERTPPNRHVLALRDQPVKVGVDESLDTEPVDPRPANRSYGK